MSMNKAKRNIASIKTPTQLRTKATAQVEKEVQEDLKVRDSSLAELINEKDDKNETVLSESSGSEESEDSASIDGEATGDE